MYELIICTGISLYFATICLFLRIKNKKQKRFQDLHNGIIDIMDSDKDQNIAFQEICDLFVEYNKYALVWIGFKKNDRISAMYAAGKAQEYVKNLYLPLIITNEDFKGPAALSFLEKQPHVVNDIQKDKSVKFWRKKAQIFNLHSLVTFPIIVNGISIGVIAFYSYNKNEFNTQIVNALQELIHHLEYSLKLSEKNKLFLKLFESNPNGICITNSESEIVNINPRFTEITGYEKSEVIGKNPRVLKSGCHDNNFYQDMWEDITKYGVWQGEILNKRKNGEIYPEILTISPIIEYNIITHYIGIFSDITHVKETQDKINYLEFHDHITNTYNKKYIEIVFPDLVSNNQINNEILAFISIDIDRFSNVNATTARSIGDKLLKAFSARIVTFTKKTDILFHLNSDEFILVVSVKTLLNINMICDRLLQNMSQTFYIDEHMFNITCSLGISIFQENGVNLDVLISNASLATYKSKKKGRNCYTFFNQEYGDAEKRLILIEAELREAIKRNELYISYQPLIDIKTGQITSAEALIRWNCEKFGHMKPSEFIPLSEEIGLTSSIGDFVLNSVLTDLPTIQKIIPDFKISINISMSQFKQNDLIQYLRELLNKYQIDGKYIALEITELIASDNITFTSHILKEITTLGITLEIDDFGTGYSNISYLYKFPIQKIKIDKIFIDNIASDPESKLICKTIIQMSQNFGLGTIAEGVEKQDQFDELAKLGCDEIQGYLISKPLPLTKFLQFLEK